MTSFRLFIKEKIKTMKQDVLKCNYSSNNYAGGYKDAIEALNSLQTNAQVLQKLKLTKNYSQENNVQSTIKYLSRSGITLDQLERELSVIHVSGTKGKGSTCAICESILHFHGYKTGFFSSPHLVAVRERIRINKTPLTEAVFAQYFWKVYNKLQVEKEHANDMPSYFKFLTVMALNVFAAEKVDVAIIEVGIGGELDCTNIFKKPAVVGITSLGLDHTSLLGNTIEEIAWQKGGIMKLGTPAFTSPQLTPALEVLNQRAVEKKCPLWEVPPLCEYDCDGLQLSIGLKGDVQTINTSLALQLSWAWINRQQQAKSSTGLLGYAKAFRIDGATAEGIKSCSWPGRYQVLTRKSDHGSCTYYLDGAHTLESIELCVQWFRQIINKDQNRSSCRYILVFNVTGDRKPTDLLVPLMSCQFDSAFFCPNISVSDPKSNDLTNYTVTSKHQLDRCEDNKNTWLSLTKDDSSFTTELETFPSVTETLKYIEGRKGEQRVLVTGSLHLVGAVLSAFDLS
uniref:Folylpolyglutamate synthase n=2 Tax=Homalodisca liturata TaxID=320908 RepID=A0A1B6K2T6_9HEMI